MKREFPTKTGTNASTAHSPYQGKVSRTQSGSIENKGGRNVIKELNKSENKPMTTSVRKGL